MKAITLWQPWATLAALGYKTIETRSWTTRHRGSLAIHAALRTRPKVLAECFSNARMCDLLRRHNLALEDLPRGAIVATVRLVDVYRTENVLSWIDSDNLALGDYSPGRYAWKLTELWAAPIPLYCTGGQRLWDWYLPIDLVTGKRIPESAFRPSGDGGIQTPCSFEFMADSTACQDCPLYLECLDTYEEVFRSV